VYIYGRDGTDQVQREASQGIQSGNQKIQLLDLDSSYEVVSLLLKQEVELWKIERIFKLSDTWLALPKEHTSVVD
jgi:hypothetical protein